METKTNTEHKASNVFTSTLQSTLLLFFIIFPVLFMDTLIHEGAHAIVGLVNGATIHMVYAHPFSMIGFVTAYEPYSPTVWGLAAGHVATILISLPLFIFLWRRRSLAILPFVMWFPWTASQAFSTIISLIQGTEDFNHVIDMTGWPAWPFFTIFSILAFVGMVLFVSCFPLIGLELKDKRTFFVILGAFLLYSLVSLIVAYLFVPGSRADVQLHMGEQIISSAIYGVYGGLVMGALFILIYFTLYPIIERKFPAYLRTEKKNLVWRDLLIPGILSVISIVVGILLIR